MKTYMKYLLLAIGTIFLLTACCKKQMIKKEEAVKPAPVKQVKKEPVKPAPAPAPKPAPVKELPPVKAEKTVFLPMLHKVVKGECLWIISSYKDIYNDPFMWPLIYRANKDKIKDPDLIFPGQVLFINRAYSDSEKNDAIHFAKTRGKWSLWDGK